MAVKCNITKEVLQKLKQLKWGVSTKNIDTSIVENYIEYLNCPSIDWTPCESYPCNNPVVHIACSLNIQAISVIVDETRVTFYVEDTDIINGLPPYQYNWTYDTMDFDLAGSINTAENKLVVKAGKKVEYIVSKIKVNIIDAQGCKATKTCYLTPTGMACGDNYAPCDNISFLLVTMVITTCPRASGLIVKKS